MLDGHRRHWSGVKLDGRVIEFRSIYPDVRQIFYVSNDVTQSIVIELHAGLPLWLCYIGQGRVASWIRH